MAERDPAFRRFALIQVMRLWCLLVVLAGAALYAERVGDDPLLGGILLVAGAAGFFLIPRQLARRWKTGKK
ncbi:hypothetical protein [Qipengyuania sp. MTN3-11]|uniref:hypothetical protein n=1 Tax=Qipengyuania sp. MTN3-11 TaxID=3056557 RepID=UPI0036F34893